MQRPYFKNNRMHTFISLNIVITPKYIIKLAKLIKKGKTRDTVNDPYRYFNAYRYMTMYINA